LSFLESDARSVGSLETLFLQPLHPILMSIETVLKKNATLEVEE
jgi:hypothetical protein